MDSLIVANVAQRPVRTFVSVLGVALGVILIVLTVGLARGVMKDFLDRQSSADAEIRFFPGGNLSIGANPLMMSARYVDYIINGHDLPVDPKPLIPGVAAVSPVGEWMQSGAGGIGFQIVDGIDYPSFIKTTQFHLVAGRGLVDEPVNEALIDRYYSEQNKVDVGGHITLWDRQFTVVGIYDPPIMSRIKVPLATMQGIVDTSGQPDAAAADPMQGNCSYLMIKAAPNADPDAIVAALKKYYPANNTLLARDLPALYSHSIKPVEIFLDVVIWLALVISTLVILLAMHTTIIERTREIGILKSLGASKRFIVLSIEKEAGLISLLGVALGFVVAVISRFWIQANTRLIIDIQPKWLLIAALIGVLAGILGALYPALSAANLDPVEALSYE